MLLQLTDVNKIYNGAPLLKHISLTIEDRDRIGLIGVNGCGKSTLLKLITERILPDHIQEGDGEIIKSSHTSIGYLEQMGGLEKEQTVWHEMHNVFQPLLDAQARMRELEQELANNSEAAAEEAVEAAVELEEPPHAVMAAVAPTTAEAFRKSRREIIFIIVFSFIRIIAISQAHLLHAPGFPACIITACEEVCKRTSPQESEISFVLFQQKEFSKDKIISVTSTIFHKRATSG